jgi:hypothetical protein
MFTTVVGLIARVYLVNFKQDMSDAKAAAEEGVIEASQKLRQQLVIALENLQSFESQVDVSVRGTIERVNLQFESISRSYGERLEEFFGELAIKNSDANGRAFDEVKEASSRLASIVGMYSNGVNANLKSLEQLIIEFSDAVSTRLKATTFPDDYFERSLAAPVAKLRDGAEAVSMGINDVAGEIKASNLVLGAALKSLRTKATQFEGVLDRFPQLADAQEQILKNAHLQLASLSRFAGTIDGLDLTLAAVAQNIELQSKALAALVEQLNTFSIGMTEGGKERHASRTPAANVPSNSSAIFTSLDGIPATFRSLNEIRLKAEVPFGSTQMVIPVYGNNSSRSGSNGNGSQKSDTGNERTRNGEI